MQAEAGYQSSPTATTTTATTTTFGGSVDSLK